MKLLYRPSLNAELDVPTYDFSGQGGSTRLLTSDQHDHKQPSVCNTSTALIYMLRMLMRLFMMCFCPAQRGNFTWGAILQEGILP